MPLNLLSGDDVFISYSRRDGALYAAGLADKLTEKGLSCFIDKLGTEPDHDLPDSLRKKIRGCAVFVLVGTQSAARSEFVEKEIAEFRKTGRTILPLDFGGAVAGARWYGLIPGLAAEPERNPGALSTGDPSPNVLGFVEKSFKYTRRNQRMFRMFLGALAVFLILAAVSVVAFFVARNQVAKANAAAVTADEQTKKAAAAARLADEKTSEAQAAAELAARKTDEAARATGLADRKAREADAASALAREKTRDAEVAQAAAVRAEGRRRTAETRARRQEQIANSREGAATALSLLATDPEEGVRQASKAYDSAPTAQAADALRRSLFDSHVRAVLRGHDEIVLDAAFDRTGRLALTAGADETLRVWDARTGREVARLRAPGAGDDRPSGALLDLALSPDGRYAAAAGRKGVALLWKLKADGAAEGEPRVLRGELSPDGRRTQCADFCAVRSVAFSADGRHLAAAGDDAAVWVWETGTDARPAALYDHNGPVSHVAFSPDGRHVLSAGPDASGAEAALLWEWRAARGDANPRPLPHPGPVESAVFSADGRHLVAATNRHVQGDTFARAEAGEGWVWETETGRNVARLAGHAGALVGAWFSPDGEFVLTAGDDATARVWRWDSEQLRDAPAVLRGHTAPLTGAEFSPDGQYVVTSSADGTARIWKPSTNRERAEEERAPVEVPALAVLRGHGASVRKAAYSPDGLHVVTAGEDRTARVWAAQVEKVSAALPQHRLFVEGAAFSPDARYVVTTTAGYHPARVWDRLEEGRRAPVAELRLPAEAHFGSAVFSPDGRFVAAFADASRDRRPASLGVAVWDWRDEAARRDPVLLKGHPGLVHSVAFSHDPGGRYILTAGGSAVSAGGAASDAEADTVRVWDGRPKRGGAAPSCCAGTRRASGARSSAPTTATSSRPATTGRCAFGTGRRRRGAATPSCSGRSCRTSPRPRRRPRARPRASPTSPSAPTAVTSRRPGAASTWRTCGSGGTRRGAGRPWCCAATRAPSLRSPSARAARSSSRAGGTAPSVCGTGARDCPSPS